MHFSAIITAKNILSAKRVSVGERSEPTAFFYYVNLIITKYQGVWS